MWKEYRCPRTGKWVRRQCYHRSKITKIQWTCRFFFVSRVAKSASTNVQRGGFSSYRVAPHQIRPANCRLATLWRTDVPQSWRTSLPKMSAKKREDKTKPCNRKSRCLVSSLTPRARYNFLESSFYFSMFYPEFVSWWYCAPRKALYNADEKRKKDRFFLSRKKQTRFIQKIV